MSTAIEIKVAKLEERLCSHKDELDRNETNIKDLTSAVYDIAGSTIRIESAVNSLTSKVESMCDTINKHVDESKVELINHTKSSVKQKIMWGIGVALTSGLLTGLYSFLFHLIKVGN